MEVLVRRTAVHVLHRKCDFSCRVRTVRSAENGEVCSSVHVMLKRRTVRNSFVMSNYVQYFLFFFSTDCAVL